MTDLMKTIPLFALALCLLAAGCKKDEDEPIRGCTDPNSINFNSQATVDDQTCEYLIDLYQGPYTSEETITVINLDPDGNEILDGNPDTTVTVLSGSFIMAERSSPNDAFVIGFNCPDTLSAGLSEGGFVIPDSWQCAIFNFVATRNANTLSYSYDGYSDQYISSYHSGTAERL